MLQLSLLAILIYTLVETCVLGGGNYNNVFT